MMNQYELDQQIECFETLARIYELLGIEFKGPDPTLAEKLAYLEATLTEWRKLAETIKEKIDGINRTT